MRFRKRTRARLLRIGLGATLGAAVATACVNALVGWVSGGGPWLLDPRHFSDKAQALAAYARHRPSCMLTAEQDPLAAVPRAAARNGIDPDLLTALVRVESGGRAHRISPAGASVAPCAPSGGTGGVLRV
jgi:hypothetical protein